MKSIVLTFFALILFIVGVGIPSFWNVTIGDKLIIGYGLIVGPIYIQTQDDDALKFIKEQLQKNNPINVLTCSDSGGNPTFNGHYGGTCSLFYAQIACIAFSLLGCVVTLAIGCGNTRAATVPSLLTTATMAATIIIYTQGPVYKSLVSTSIIDSICTVFLIIPGSCKANAWYIGGPLAIAGAGLQGLATIGFMCAQIRANRYGEIP